MIICSHGSTKTFGEDWSGNLDSGRTEIVKKKKQKQNKSWHIKESAQSAAHLTGD